MSLPTSPPTDPGPPPSAYLPSAGGLRRLAARGLDLLGGWRAAGVCAVIYVVVTAAGALQAGKTSDDWRGLAGTPAKWAEIEGRWVADVIYTFLLNERPLLPLQLLLTFLCLLSISVLLVRLTVRDDRYRPLFVLLLFVAGVNYVYMLDILHFDTGLFSTLAMLCSLGAFHLILDLDRWRSRLVALGVILLSAQLLALAFGIYQSFAALGLAIPAIIVMSIRQRGSPEVARYLAVCMGMGLAALALYFAEQNGFLWLTGRSNPLVRFESATWSDVVLKVREAPQLLAQLHSGGFLVIPTVVRGLLATLALATLALAGVVALRELRTPRTPGADPGWLSAARVVAGTAAAMFVIPLMAWFAYKRMFIPPRSIGYAGFLFVAVFIMNLSLLVGDTARSRVSGVVRAVGVLLLLMVAGASTALAGAIWDDLGRAAARDAELARVMYTRVTALPGYDGERFRVAGGVSYPDLLRGGSIGHSVFHDFNPDHAIIREMFGVPWNIEALPFSPVPCTAFPADGSVFMHEGQAYVCLTEFDEVLPLSGCIETGRPEQPTVCTKSGFIILPLTDCTQPHLANRFIEVLLHDGTSGEPFLGSFRSDASVFELGDRCYRAVRDGGVPFNRLTIREYELNRGVLWERTFPVPALELQRG